MGLLRQPVVQVPTQAQSGSDEQDGFSGGVNPAAAVGIVDPTQYAAVTNMRLVRDQEMAKRPGLVSVGTLVGNPSIFIPYDFGTANGGGRFLALTNATAGSAIQRGTWTAGSPNTPTTPGTVTFSNVGTVGGTNFIFNGNAAQFRDATNDCLYVAVINTVVGNTPGMSKWDSAGTWTEQIAGTKVQALQYLWVYNQRLFGCKGTQTLYWSGLNNGDTMADTANGGGSAQIRTFGGQNIVGGFALGGTNYILHENAISSFRGLTFDDISITAGTQGVSPNTGYPLAWNVIDHVGYILTMQGLVIVTEAGVSFYNSPSTPDPILQFLRTTVGFFDQKSYVVDNARRNEIWFYVGARAFSGGINLSKVFIYNKRLQRFTGQATLGVSPLWIWSTANDAGALHGPQLLMATSTKILGTDFIYDASNAYTDDGSTYTSSVQMRRFYTEKPSYQKAYRFLNINMGGGSGETLTATGTSTGASVTYSTTTGGTVVDTTNMKAQEVNIIQLSGQGSYLDATITDNGASSTGWSVLRADVDAYILAQRAG